MADGIGSGSSPDTLSRAGDFLQDGGPVVVILVAMSVVATTVALMKIWQFATLRVGNTRAAQEALLLHRAGRSAEAAGRAERSANPAARVLALAIRGRMRGVPDACLREEIFRTGSDLLEGLRGWLRVLEIIGTLAPLLGLFGTVLGMIEAFRRMEAAGAQVNPAVLSGGIWEALLTTAVGLAVAIPVVAVLNWLERRVDRLSHEMDTLVSGVFTAPYFATDREDEGNAVAFAAHDAAAPGE